MFPLPEFVYAPQRGARGLLASNLGNHKPTAVGSSGMRLRILALVALCACPLAATAKTGAAPPLPDRNPLIAMAQADAAPSEGMKSTMLATRSVAKKNIAVVGSSFAYWSR